MIEGLYVCSSVARWTCAVGYKRTGGCALYCTILDQLRREVYHNRTAVFRGLRRTTRVNRQLQVP